MKLIVGLGNPGPDYERTRHNAGFMAIDRLADRHAPAAPWRGQFQSLAITVNLPQADRAILLKPTTFMNLSGRAVSEAVRFYKLDPAQDILIISDDIALPAGHIRGRASGGAGGHNGLANINQLLATPDYPRLRIGVDPKGLANQADYVLSRFTEDQWSKVDPALNRAADFCETWAAHDLATAMNKFNTKQPKPDPKQHPETQPKPENDNQPAHPHTPTT